MISQDKLYPITISIQVSCADYSKLHPHTEEEQLLEVFRIC